ncbi:hypothetical protein AB205_0050570, partial [Aquarana catesbeiana]
MSCPDHEWPNENRTRCIPKQVEFLSFTDDKISFVFITFLLLCFGKTLLVLVIFILHRDTPVVKANNKSLSFVLLVSIMLGFLCVFLFLGHPVDVTCLLRQISFGILFTIAVSSVLTKTIMVCIAFKATKPNSVWRKWIGVKLPTCIVLACSSVQVIICISWLSISPPFQELDTHSYQEKIIIQCNEGSVIGFYSVLGYMGILATVSFIIAFFARTLPDSFNEAKYITFSMLVFCSVWIAMIPAYLSTKGKYTVAVEIFAILISNNGLLYCIFLTKCFIILCRPELNTKIPICSLLSACHLQILSAYEDYEYVQDGDIIIGGVFTVNCLMAGWTVPKKLIVTGMFCMKPLHHYYKKLQMFLFAIDQVNNNPTILPNVTLGYYLYDSCSDPRKAIKSVLQILSGPGETIPNYSCRDHQKLAGFIGDQSSTTTLPIAQILSVYNHVQVSYGATDNYLNDRAAFPNFYRTVQDDFMIYCYVSELMRHFGWTWVGIITSGDESGEIESSWLLRFLSRLQICVAFLIRTGINVFTESRDLESAYSTLEKSSVKVIILCGTYHDAMFQSSMRRLFRDITLILPPNWASHIALIEKYPEILNCSLSLNFWSEADKNFKNFVDSFQPMIRPKDKLLEICG